MAQPLTDEERARICCLYRQWRDSETRHRAIEKIATPVSRGWTLVQEVLVKGKLIPAPRPRGLSDRLMKKAAESYRGTGWSIRECARRFELSYGVVQAVLLYEGVELRGRGGAGRGAHRPDDRGQGGRDAALGGEPGRCTVDDVPAGAVIARSSGVGS